MSNLKTVVSKKIVFIVSHAVTRWSE